MCSGKRSVQIVVIASLGKPTRHHRRIVTIVSFVSVSACYVPLRHRSMVNCTRNLFYVVQVFCCTGIWFFNVQFLDVLVACFDLDVKRAISIFSILPLSCKELPL